LARVVKWEARSTVSALRWFQTNSSGNRVEDRELGTETSDERLGLFSQHAQTHDQRLENLVFVSAHEPPEKLDEHLGIDAPFSLIMNRIWPRDGDGRGQAHATALQLDTPFPARAT
jgi:hypothetical protein